MHILKISTSTRIFLFPVALRPNTGHGCIHEVSRSHITTHHSRQDSSGRVISPSQRPLPDSTQHSHQTNIHTADGNRTHNLTRGAAVDARLRQRGYFDGRQSKNVLNKIRFMESTTLLHVSAPECHRQGVF